MKNFRPNIIDYDFLVKVFIAAFLVRAILATLIVLLELQQYFGPDARYYDYLGGELADSWWGSGEGIILTFDRSGWGMPYFVAGIYFFTGQNALAAQLIMSAFGAAAPVLGYFCALEIFKNTKVARYTTLLIGFFPFMIVWTSQLLKESLVIFFLLLAFLATLKLQKRLTQAWGALLFISLVGLASLRFYIFFIVVAAILASWVIGINVSVNTFINRLIICVFVGVAFFYLGIWSLSQQQAEKYLSLERVKISREWASRAARSGFLRDNDHTDITTISGIISTLPRGIITLYLAPFPWQFNDSIKHVIIIPDVLAWWASLPFVFVGVLYSIKYQFRKTIPMLFLVLALSLSYALYQGNLGTLYRQRIQIQVFLLIFAAAGFVVRSEARENSKIRESMQVSLRKRIHK